MPLLSRLMIRAALLWMALGYTLGGLMLANKGLNLLSALWLLRLPHAHILLLGWMVQFAFGVAFWMLPRLDAAGSRGDERPAWVCFAAINAGVVLAALAGAMPGWPPARVGAVLAGPLYVLAGVAFIIHLWPRVVSFRALPRG